MKLKLLLHKKVLVTFLLASTVKGQFLDVVGCTSCDTALMRHMESYKAMKHQSVMNEWMYRYTEGQRDVKYEIVIYM